MDLGLELTERDGFAVLAVSGEIDVSTAPPLRERLIGLVDDGWKRVVVDMEGVEFLDSTGLGVLVAVLKRLQAVDGELRLVCTRGQLLKVFEITGLNMVFSVFNSLDAATASTPSA
jgi:anti-sigma B factor antagonist